MFRNYNMMDFGGFFAGMGFWFIPLMIWTFFWKGLALWRSAKAGDKYWFIALLLINTAGLLEIAYLFAFAKDKLTIKEVEDTVTGQKSKK